MGPANNTGKEDNNLLNFIFSKYLIKEKNHLGFISHINTNNDWKKKYIVI